MPALRPRTSGLLDAVAPVEVMHPLNTGLLARYPCVPGWMGGSRLVNVARAGDRDGSHGTLSLPTLWRGPGGRPGGYGSLSFNGTGDYVVINAMLSAPIIGTTGAITFSIWAYSAANGSDTCAVSWGGSDDLLLYPFDTVGGNGARVYWRDCGGTGQTNENSADRSGAWHHFLYAARTGEQRLYVDGVFKLAATEATTGAGPFISMRMGQWATLNTQRHVGLLDDFCVWSRFLSAAEVRAAYEDSMLGSPATLRWLPTRTIFIPAAAPAGGNRRRRAILCGGS